ncbi:MAG: type II toxin-antitoxin system VapC family toxin [Chthoniobacterales bacterium]
MKKRLFVDTAGWMACADRNDPAHARSVAVRDAKLRAGFLLVTTDYVLDETLTLLRLRLGLGAARDWWEGISRSPRVIVAEVDAELRDRAMEWFFRYEDKDFSFTDCTSFAFMRQEKIREVLTTDRHFRQAGFEVVVESKG